MQSVLADAVEHYRREQFWDECSAACARLREDPEAWAEELKEREEWDTTLLDGLGDDEWEEDPR
jgi:hypothetical protein